MHAMLSNCTKLTNESRMEWSRTKCDYVSQHETTLALSVYFLKRVDHATYLSGLMDINGISDHRLRDRLIIAKNMASMLIRVSQKASIVPNARLNHVKLLWRQSRIIFHRFNPCLIPKGKSCRPLERTYLRLIVVEKLFSIN